MLCRLDVFLLTALVARTKQHDDRASPLLKTDAVSRPVVDTQFADALANRLDVACVPLSQPIQSRSDHRSGAVIPEPHTPLSKRLCLLQLKRM